MLRQLLQFTFVPLAILTCLGAPALAADCALLPEAVLRQVVPGPIAAIEQSSELPDRCRYQWPKADQALREQENAERRRQAMRRGHEDLAPLPLWNEVTIELLATAETEVAARVLFENYLRQQLPEHFGSPDPLAGTQLEKAAAAAGGRQPAWSAASQQLLVQIGNRLLLLHVSLEEDAVKNKAMALMIGNILL